MNIGDTFIGLTQTDYLALLDNDEIAAFLADYTTQEYTINGVTYIAIIGLNGLEFLDLLDEEGIEGINLYKFQYLKSSWIVNGF